MLRRLHKDQPADFAFTPANDAWAEGQVSKYPEGRQASAIIPLLWRAQEQEGWLSRPAIEHVADRLGMAYIRALEVATFYYMFQLHPVGSVAHIQICGTTSCMICGAEDLVAVCKEMISPRAQVLSADGKFSWEEVECLGACANAPMAQIGKDYYEDLTPATLRDLIARFSRGEVPVPGSQAGRYAAEPASGLTSLAGAAKVRPHNGSVQMAVDIGDTVRRIDGTEVPLLTPWVRTEAVDAPPPGAPPPERGAPDLPAHPKLSEGRAIDDTGISVQESPASSAGRPPEEADASSATPAATPEAKAPVMDAPAPGAAPAPGTRDLGDTAAAPVPSATEPDRAATGDDAAVEAGPAGVASRDAGPASPAPAVASTPAGAVRPDGLSEARNSAPDDLKIIVGIGPILERLCHSLGFFHFDQIAAWTEAEIAWVDANLTGFRGRVTRDKWVPQARTIVEIGPAEFLRRLAPGGTV